MPEKASALLSAILRESPEHPSATQLKKVLRLVKQLETHCAELAEDSQKMAKRIVYLHSSQSVEAVSPRMSEETGPHIPGAG